MNITDCVRTETVLGKPLVIENLTLIPVIEIDVTISAMGFSMALMNAKIMAARVLVLKEGEFYTLCLDSQH